MKTYKKIDKLTKLVILEAIRQKIITEHIGVSDTKDLENQFPGSLVALQSWFDANRPGANAKNLWNSGEFSLISVGRELHYTDGRENLKWQPELRTWT